MSQPRLHATAQLRRLCRIRAWWRCCRSIGVPAALLLEWWCSSSSRRAKAGEASESELLVGCVRACQCSISWQQQRSCASVTGGRQTKLLLACALRLLLHANSFLPSCHCLMWRMPTVRAEHTQTSSNSHALLLVMHPCSRLQGIGMYLRAVCKCHKALCSSPHVRPHVSFHAAAYVHVL